MSHHRASRDKNISPGEPATRRAGHQDNRPALAPRFKRLGTKATIGAQQEELAVRGPCRASFRLSQMWSQDVPRDWARNPSPALFSPPLSLSWLLLTSPAKGKPLTTKHRHPLLWLASVTCEQVASETQTRTETRQEGRHKGDNKTWPNESTELKRLERALL